MLTPDNLNINLQTSSATKQLCRQNQTSQVRTCFLAPTRCLPPLAPAVPHFPPISNTAIPDVHKLLRHPLSPATQQGAIHEVGTGPSLIPNWTRTDQINLYPKTRKAEPPATDRIQDIARRSLKFLHQELINRIEASNKFPPAISTTEIRAAITRYEETIEDTGKWAVCASCGRQLSISDIHSVGKNDRRLRLLGSDLDHCGQQGHTWNLCST
jgi:hypothetical protein